MANDALNLTESAVDAAKAFTDMVERLVNLKSLADKLFGVHLGGTGIRHDGDNQQVPPRPVGDMSKVPERNK